MPRNARRSGIFLHESQSQIGRMQTAFQQLKSLLFGTRHRPSELTADHIRSSLAIRRARNLVFGKELFSDPAWDVLLELYAAELECRSVTLSELALSREAPQSTTARWIVELEWRGLVTTADDLIDPLNLRLQLSGKATSAMKELTDHWRSAFRSI